MALSRDATSGSRSKEVEELHSLISQHLRCAAVPGYVIESVERSLEKALRSEPNFNSHLLQRFHQLPIQHVEAKVTECKKACLADNTSDRATASHSTLFFTRSWALALLGVLALSMVFAPCVAYSEWCRSCTSWDADRWYVDLWGCSEGFGIETLACSIRFLLSRVQVHRRIVRGSSER